MAPDLKHNIFIELDGILSNYYFSAREYALEKYNKVIIDDSWYGHTLTEREIINMHRSKEFYNNMNLLPFANNINKLDYNIIITTDRVMDKGLTLSWLVRNKINFDIVLHRSTIGKKNLIKDFKPVAIIDRDFSFLSSCIEKVNKLVYVYNPWSNFSRPEIVSVPNLENIVTILNDK
jgi:hypothetical protein